MKARASRNRTLTCSLDETRVLGKQLLSLESPVTYDRIENKIIQQDIVEAVQHLPSAFVDLLILDPPYNLTRDYNGTVFKRKHGADYKTWFASLLRSMKPLLKEHASIYVCADWKTSVLIAPLLEEAFHVRNRITWEREKGRGAIRNWKNCCEDVWFCTVCENYTFNVDAVKLKRKVIAPYRTDEGRPKDWREEGGANFRMTSPSNVWTDISVPFWSMRENTDHPTQKPEKLIAKLILASSNEGDTVLDPFLGSGTSAVVARKLGRRFVGVEINPTYACWALKRLEMADDEQSIQGYSNGVFWERNTFLEQSRGKTVDSAQRVRLL